MNPILPPYLRLHLEDEQQPADPLQSVPGLRVLSKQFEQVTGWTLTFRETAESYQQRRHARNEPLPPPKGKLVIDDLSAELAPGKSACHRVRCEELVESINELMVQLEDTRTELWKREAELATAVPVVQSTNDGEHIATRLQTSLKAAVDASEATAAALYVLDDATSELKLRAAWGLPDDRPAQPARPLQGAFADLEALIGHAVVIEDTELLQHWNPPESFPAGACVPVSSATTPLGTLWVFDNDRRDFSSEQTNLLEIVAGRIAAELEREAAMGQGALSVEVQKNLEQARHWQESRLPNVQPIIDEIEIQGWTQQSGMLGGDFHGWSVLTDGNLALSLGDVQAPMFEAGLGAANLQALVQCHAEYQKSPGQVLCRVGESLWSGSMGDHFASLLFGVLDVPTRKFSFSAAGCVGAILLAKNQAETLSDTLPPLGGDPDTFYSHLSRSINPGDFFIAFSDGVRHRLAMMGAARDDEELAAKLRRSRPTSAAQIIDVLRGWLQVDAAREPRYDMSLLVLRGR